MDGFISVSCEFLSKRKISEDTCRRYGYGGGEYKGQRVQVANYYDAGVLVAQHVRFPDKAFRWIGSTQKLELFGQHLFREKGKRIIVTEGEIDCLTVSQVLGGKWQVVSVPNGASSAKKYLQQNLEFLESYEEIILSFDMDEPGKKAAADCAVLFSPGKCKVVSLPRKDANEMLVVGEVGELVRALWDARPYRPDGIMAASDLTLDTLKTQKEIFAYDTPYPEINKMLKGLRKAELTLCTAGSGIGKSTLVREIAHHLQTRHALKIGYIALEESVEKTALGFVAIENDVSLGDLYLDRSLLTDDQWEKSYEKILRSDRLYLYDHFGSLESDNLISKLRYLAVGCAVDFIVLDHISIVVSGMADGDERRIIDNLMTSLRSLVENTGVGVIAICHLKVTEGKAHEEGGRVTLNHLRGSGALKQLSDNIIALERDQQGENPNVSLARILKNRLFGIVGVADELIYNHTTGRLLPHTGEKGLASSNQQQNDDF